MTASRIVEALDEGEPCASRLGLRLEPAAIEQFAFEGREEAFAHGVVIGIADRTHRGSHTCLTTAVAAIEVYCEPWSEWWITPLGRRVMSAMFRASSTSRVASVVAIDQPTMRRLKASSTTAR